MPWAYERNAEGVGRQMWAGSIIFALVSASLRFSLILFLGILNLIYLSEVSVKYFYELVTKGRLSR
jgi:hypothetical protein